MITVKPCFVYESQNILALVRGMSDEELARVALRVAELDPEVFSKAVARSADLKFTVNGIEIVVTQHDLAKIQTYYDKIMAIKWMREHWGIGLREAKDLSEMLAEGAYVTHNHWIPWKG